MPKDNPGDSRVLIKVQRKYRLIGEAMIDAGIMDHERLLTALDEQKITKESIGEIMVRLGLVQKEVLQRFLADMQGIKRWNKDEYPVNKDMLLEYDRETLIRYKIIPLKRLGGVLTVATSNISDISMKYEIERLSQCKTEFIYGGQEEIDEVLSEHIGQRLGGRSLSNMLVRLDESPVTAATAENDTLVIDLINAIFEEAITGDASDIHFEPEEKVLRIRERIDGILRHRLVLSRLLHPPLVTRLKIMAGMDITEMRLPQDGKFRFSYNDKREKGSHVDIRVSTFLTQHGENVVCRILRQESYVVDIKHLVPGRKSRSLIERAINSPYGMILVSGPTGSGKTTTLYTLISNVNAFNKNIMTIEDPIEVALPMVHQSQINPKAGITFEKGLRAILRQDPDIILIGEMRDKQTVDIAIRASLTGHLVFSTIHTNDAVSVISRLREMGIEQYLIASSLTMVIAQRLVRKICPACKRETEPEDRFRPYIDKYLNDHFRFYRGKGCDICKESGYAGRTAVMEILPVTKRIREMISQGAGIDEIEKEARKDCPSLWDNTMEKVRDGVTTLEEAVRIAYAEEY